MILSMNGLCYVAEVKEAKKKQKKQKVKLPHSKFFLLKHSLRARPLSEGGGELAHRIIKP